MKTRLLFTNILILILLGFGPDISGQPKAETNIKTVINGKAWIPKTAVALGEQFFLDRLDLKGSFQYKGIQFDNIEFAYDLSTERIIMAVETLSKTMRNIVVNPYFLEGFSVDDGTYDFDFLRGALLHKKLDSLAYYQVVESHSLRYVIKRKKYKVLKSNESREYRYIKSNSLYLIKDNQLIHVNSKKDILKFFPQKKKEMKRFIRSNKLKIGTKTPMDAVVLLLKFDL